MYTIETKSNTAASTVVRLLTNLRSLHAGDGVALPSTAMGQYMLQPTHYEMELSRTSVPDMAASTVEKKFSLKFWNYLTITAEHLAVGSSLDAVHQSVGIAEGNQCIDIMVYIHRNRKVVEPPKDFDFGKYRFNFVFHAVAEAEDVYLLSPKSMPYIPQLGELECVDYIIGQITAVPSV